LILKKIVLPSGQKDEADKIKYFTSVHPYVGEEVDHTKIEINS
jgi:hypothetical protein